MPFWMQEFAPIAILLVVVGVVISRLPRVEGVVHSDAYRRRRVMNWLPLGLTYAFLYMGRYNIKVSQHAFGDIDFNGAPMMTNSDFVVLGERAAHGSSGWKVRHLGWCWRRRGDEPVDGRRDLRNRERRIDCRHG